MNRAEDYARVGTNEISSHFPLSVGKGKNSQALRQSSSARAKEFYRLQAPKETVADIAPRRALIVGDSHASVRLAHELKRHFPQHYKVVGIVTPTAGQVSPNGVPVIGSLPDIADLARQHHVDDVLVADFFDPEFKETEETIAEHTEQRASAAARATSKAGSYKIVKRGLDIVFSLAALAATGPLVAALGVLNKLTAPGPILFCQERVGLNGKRFKIYKLRTMRVDAEAQSGPVLAQHRDNRCTPLGAILRATKIDELPQLFNVLKGDMSVVGPRPERPVFTDVYDRHVPNYAERHAVLPGLTGIAQTNGDQLTHVNVKLHYDLTYVHNYSLWLDAVLFLRTPLAILNMMRQKPEENLWESDDASAVAELEQDFSEQKA